MASAIPVVFNDLRPNQKIRHKNGVCYHVVRVVPADPVNKVWARWRNGEIGRYGKEVVRISPAHVKGFLHHLPRTHNAARHDDSDADE